VRVRDRAKLLPIPVDARVALVNCVPVDAYGILTATRGIGPNQGEPAYEAFEAELSIHLRGIKAYRFERLSREGELPEDLLRAEVVIAVTEDYTLPGADFDTLSQRVIVRRLAEKCGDRLLIVGLRAPYELSDYPRAGTYVCACSSRPCGARAAAKALVGGAPLGDHLPVSVPGTESAEG
jgi:beta-N-acetylhexosaminidase